VVTYRESGQGIEPRLQQVWSLDLMVALAVRSSVG